MNSHYSKLFKQKIFFVLFCGVLILFCATAVTASGVPTIFSYQGRLTNSAGNLLGGTGTSYNFKFSIWNSASVGSGSKVWPSGEPQVSSLLVRQGVFSVNVGDTTNGYPDALNLNFAANPDIYLQVEVFNGTSYEPLTPRQRISSSIFAQVSGAVSGLGQSSFGTLSPFSSSVVSISATSTQSTALTLRGALDQLANIFQVQDSTGSELLVVDKDGHVGVGGGSTSRKLNVLDIDSVAQLRLSQSGSSYGELYVDPTGDLQLSTAGGNIRQQNENLWVCSGGSCGAESPSDRGNVIVENAVILDNNFKLKQIADDVTAMYDSTGEEILLFDEGQ